MKQTTVKLLKDIENQLQLNKDSLKIPYPMISFSTACVRLFADQRESVKSMKVSQVSKLLPKRAEDEGIKERWAINLSEKSSSYTNIHNLPLSGTTLTT